MSVSANFQLEELTVQFVSDSIFLFFLFFVESGSDLTDSDNCPLSPLLGWSFLMSFVRACACVCVCIYICVCVSVCVWVGERERDEHKPRSRMQTDTQMLPTELSPQWVCVSCWALSFLTRRELSTGGWRAWMEDGWVEGGRETGLPLPL